MQLQDKPTARLAVIGLLQYSAPAVQLKSLHSKLTSQERKQEERSRELDYLKQELCANEQAREQSDRLIASLQTHLEQETHTAQQHAKHVGISVNIYIWQQRSLIIKYRSRFDLHTSALSIAWPRAMWACTLHCGCNTTLLKEQLVFKIWCQSNGTFRCKIILLVEQNMS